MVTAATSRQPALAIATLLVATALACAAIVLAAIAAMGSSEAVGALRHDIAALRRASGPNATDSATPVGVLIDAATTGQGSAALQQRLTEIATANGVRLVSVQALPVKRQGSLAEVAVLAAANSRIEGLRALIHAVETGLPVLIVDEIAIRRAPAPGSAQPLAGGPPVPLEATLRIRGFMAAGGAQ